MDASLSSTTDELPNFRYHPDPIATGSIVETTASCVVCERARGFEYQGPIFGPDSPDGSLCPWCIADGSAVEQLDICFDAGDGSLGIAPAIVDEVVMRTPGFLAWQESYWEYHCEDACAYLGRVGATELAAMPSRATDAVRRSLHSWGRTEDERASLLATLRVDGNLNAYLFHCLRCDEFVAHCDAA